jgi:hypothetical protein
MDFTDLEGWVFSFIVTTLFAILVNTGMFVWSKFKPVSKVWKEWQFSFLICQGVVSVILVVLAGLLLYTDHAI